MIGCKIGDLCSLFSNFKTQTFNIRLVKFVKLFKTNDASQPQNSMILALAGWNQSMGDIRT